MESTSKYKMELNEKTEDLESLESDIENVFGERLRRLKASKSAKLGAITRKGNEIKELMENVCNVEVVKSKMENEFLKLCKEMEELNDFVHDLMSTQDAKEGEKDQVEWYKPKAAALKEFADEVTKWTAAAPVYVYEEKDVKSKIITPQDSASNVKSTHSKGSKRSSRSSIASAKLKLEGRKAELLARAVMLTQKQALEREEAILKAKREQLELETEIAANTAKLGIIKEFEQLHGAPPPSGDGMNDYFEDGLIGDPYNEMSEVYTQGKALLASSTLEPANAHTKADKQKTNIQVRKPAAENVAPVKISSQVVAPAATSSAVTAINDTQHMPGGTRYQRQQTSSVPSSGTSSSMQADGMSNLVNIMERQNVITETLVKQQKLSSLPPLSIPTFNGNPLDYQFFMRAFEHGIEEKTENSKDRLYFLEQCTVGQPRELVRSCQYMQADRGYTEAKRLLKHYYGDEYQIAMAYIDKALHWSPIKAEDPEALKAFSVFLNGCLNTMETVDYMEEMDYPANMSTVLSKLPYKLKEKWRVKACDVQDKENRPAKFVDLVQFIDKQARILSHPAFGNLKDSPMNKPSHTFVPAIGMKTKQSKSGFATSVTAVSQPPLKHVSKLPSNLCIYCQGKHKLAACLQILKKTHKEKLEFLKTRGLCFGCLEKGHMSKGCKQRLTCKQCKLNHPILLHIASKEKEGTVTNASSALVDMDESRGGKDTGAGEPEGTLAVVPVKVKTKKVATQ